MAELNLNLFEILFSLGGRNSLLDDFFIFLAEFFPYVLVLGFIAWALSRGDRRINFLIVAEGVMAVILSSGIITELIGFFYPTPRPFEALSVSSLITESSSSFPSGHATFFFALATVIFYHNKRLGWWFFAFALINGFARIVAGVHWPLDILGGATVGILSGLAIHELVKPYFKILGDKNVSIAQS